MNECKECGNMFNPPKFFTEEVRRYSLTSFCKDCILKLCKLNNYNGNTFREEIRKK